MTTDFVSFNLRPELAQVIVELGYEEPTPIQVEMIPLMMTGVDVIGQAQTGTGKTAAFALPILNNLQPGGKAPKVLVMAPTRELALQVADAIGIYGKAMNVRVTTVYGGAPYQRQINELRRGVDIVVGTPGRLIDLIEKNVLQLSEIKTVVLDEADEMLSMGFVEDIETILAETPTEHQTALFSATMPIPIRRLADKYMVSPQSVTIKKSQVTTETVEQRVYMVNEFDKTAALTRLFEMEDIKSALIFVRTRIGTGELANELSNRGFSSEALNGDLSQDARERTLNRFRSGQLKVLVATDVAARGLDIEDISHVFNYDLPDDHEVYVHRIGRTGRAGKSGIAISLATIYERRKLRDIERFANTKLIVSQVPTKEQIIEKRENELVQMLEVWLARGRSKNERQIVEKMVQENGADPIEIAAVALKILRSGDKQRPIAEISPLPEMTDRRDRGQRSFRNERSERSGQDRGQQQRSSSRDEKSHDHYQNPKHEHFPGAKFGPKSHELGMVRVKLTIGREHGVRPNDIVGALAYFAEIPGKRIGKIYIEDSNTLVDVPEEFIGQVMNKKANYIIRKQKFSVETIR